jgi:hypothetical protein
MAEGAQVMKIMFVYDLNNRQETMLVDDEEICGAETLDPYDVLCELKALGVLTDVEIDSKVINER